MTGEQFRSAYKLLKMVTELGVQSHHAVSPNGRVVMVHFMVATTEENRRLLGLVDRLEPVDRRRILEKLDVDGSTVLVTEFVQGFKTLAAWLEAKVPAPLPPTAPALAPASPSPAAPGEFTRMFGADELAVTAPREPSPAADPEPPPPLPSPPPGEFTGLFEAAPPPTPPPPPPPPPPSPPSAAEPTDRRPVVRWKDEATNPDAQDRDKPVIRWKKQSPGAAPPPAPAPPPTIAPPNPAGEFTRLFGAVGATPPPAPSPSTPAPPSSVTPGAGEFTALFNPAPEKPVAPLGGPDADADRLIRALDTPATPPAKTSPISGSPVPPAPAASAPAAPGEFTRMMSGLPASGPAARGAAAGPGPSEFTRLVAPMPPAPASAAAPAPTPAAAPAGEATRRPLLPIILASVAFVFLVAVALYFVLR